MLFRVSVIGIGIAVCFIQLHTPLIASESTCCPIFLHHTLSSPQSNKYPKANPIHKRRGYAVAYDGRAKTALWVYEELTRDSLKGNVNRDHFDFTQDPDIPPVISSTKKDYKYSGFDRGHLAPAGDHKAEELQMKETFYLSNISPQVPSFNQRYWKSFEQHVRDLTNEYDVVRVVTGPLYFPYEASNGKKYVTYEVIGDNNVAVPTHFFKVITLEKGASKEQRAYVMPNEKIDKNTPLSDFQATVSKVEKVSGIIFQR